MLVKQRLPADTHGAENESSKTIRTLYQYEEYNSEEFAWEFQSALAATCLAAIGLKWIKSVLQVSLIECRGIDSWLGYLCSLPMHQSVVLLPPHLWGCSYSTVGLTLTTLILKQAPKVPAHLFAWTTAPSELRPECRATLAT